MFIEESDQKLYFDQEELVEFVSKKTGYDVEKVEKVLDWELEFLVMKGIAINIEDN